MASCSSDDNNDATPTKDKNKTVTVTFDLNYTGAAAPTTASVAKDKNATKPADPTRDGYTFGGWYTKQDGSGTAFAFGTTPINANITLYAGWQRSVYTVTFDLNYDGATGTPPVAQTIKKNLKASEPTTVPTRTSFIFVGWYTDEAATKAFNFTTTPITADITLYAKWSNNAVAITFDTGTGASTVPVKNVEKGSTTTAPTPPTRTGYTFDGWYTKQDGSGTAFVFDTTTITADITLYAGWTPVYTVTFDLGGGTGTVPDPQTVTKGDKATKPATPTKEGYVFDGWYDDKTAGNKFVFDTTTITADTKLYARWTIKTYTVTFDLSGGTAGTTPTTASVEHGKTTTEPATPTKEGYVFDGWYDDKTAGNKFVFDTTTITADTKLYARWTIETYTVTFDLGGGTGTAPDPQTIAKNKNATAPADPTKDGYVFKGWYEKQDGSGTAFAFDTTPITDDTTLYAKWICPARETRKALAHKVPLYNQGEADAPYLPKALRRTDFKDESDKSLLTTFTIDARKEDANQLPDIWPFMTHNPTLEMITRGFDITPDYIDASRWAAGTLTVRISCYSVKQVEKDLYFYYGKVTFLYKERTGTEVSEETEAFNKVMYAWTGIDKRDPANKDALYGFMVSIQGDYLRPLYVYPFVGGTYTRASDSKTVTFPKTEAEYAALTLEDLKIIATAPLTSDKIFERITAPANASGIYDGQ